MGNVKTLTIEDREYTTVILPPIKAVMLHARLCSMFGGTIGKILPKDLEGQQSAVLPVIAAALQGVDAEKLPGLIVDLIGQVKLGGTSLDKTVFDKHFSMYGADIYPLAAWVIWENVKSFLAKSGGGWSSVIQEIASSSPATM